MVMHVFPFRCSLCLLLLAKKVEELLENSILRSTWLRSLHFFMGIIKSRINVSFWKALICFYMAIITFFATPSHAQVSLSGGNLGYTSFMDGFGYPGFVSDQYLYFYYADEFTDAHGNKKSTNKMHNLMLLMSFKYIFEKPKIFGAWPGIDVELPIMFDLQVENDRFNETERNVGDFFIGFFLQYPEMRLFNKIPFWQRLDLLIKFPTGHYDSDSYVNAGNNAYAINPYYAFTVFLTPKIEYSMRLFYKWTSKNNDPSQMVSPEWNPKSGTPPKFADDVQEGQAVWTNFASSYGITNNFRLGINGYYLKQITNHKIDGHSIPDSKEEVFAIGPGAMYIADNKKDIYWFNMYAEVYSENRAKGMSVVVRWLHVF